MTPSSPSGRLSSTLATRRGRSRKTRSEAASVSRRKVAVVEFSRAWTTGGSCAQMPCTVSRGMSSSWHSSRVSASADRALPSATPSSPNTPPGWMIVSVSSPPSADRTTTLTRPEMITNTVSLGSPRVNTTCPRRKTRNRDAVATASRTSAGTEPSRSVCRKMLFTSAVIAGPLGRGVAGHGPQDGLHFVRHEVWVLAEQPGHQAGHVRRGERVAGGDDGGTGQPRHLDVDAGCPEVHRGRGVRVEAERVAPVVSGHGDNRGELSGVGRRRNIVGGADQDRAGEGRLVCDLVEKPEIIIAARTQRQVDDPRAVGDGPANTGREHRAFASQPTAEHTHRPQGRGRGNAPDDACTCGAVTEQILVRVLGSDDLFGLGVPPQGNCPVYRTDGGVGGVDTAVDHGDDDAGAGSPAPRPFLVDGHIHPSHSAQRLGGEGVAPRRSQRGRGGRLSAYSPMSRSTDRASRRSSSPRRARTAKAAAIAARSASAAGSPSAAWRSATASSSPDAASASPASSTRPNMLNVSTVASARAA